jgi:hypothetical protein
MEANIAVGPLFIIVISMLSIVFVLGFYVGKYKERGDWNELIRQGKINKPGRRK